ncbi:MAG: ABC transporter permease [Bacillota bacterium]
MAHSGGLPAASRTRLLDNFMLYLELIRMEFINNLAYRSSYFTGIFNYAIQIGAYFFLWDAVYTGRRVLGGLNKEQMLTYVIIAWVVRSFYFSNLDRHIANEIRQGKIAMELIRPYNYQLVKFARAFGEAIFRVIFFAVPGGVLMYMIHPFGLPPGPVSALVFAAAAVLSFFINAQISMIAGMFAFFTQSVSGIYRAKRVVMDLFSGLLLPISFYPDWAQQVIKLLPFQAVSYLPNLVYLGKIQGGAAVQVLLTQVFWLVVLYITSALFWRFAVRHVVVQGG